MGGDGGVADYIMADGVGVESGITGRSSLSAVASVSNVEGVLSTGDGIAVCGDRLAGASVSTVESVLQGIIDGCGLPGSEKYNFQSWDRQQRRRAEQSKGRPVKRAFHRLLSGTLFGTGNGEDRDRLRFITLTSAHGSVRDPLASFKALKHWFSRRGIDLQYFLVKEFFLNGMIHLHVLYRGPFIYQWFLSELWERIHGAPVVDIRATYGKKSKIANYLIKYLVKGVGEGIGTAQVMAADAGYIPAVVVVDKPRKLWSCSRDWCYRQFTLVWKRAVHLWSQARLEWKALFSLWDMHLRGDSTPAKFLRWVTDACGAESGDFESVRVSILGNRGYFASRSHCGYEK